MNTRLEIITLAEKIPYGFKFMRNDEEFVISTTNEQLFDM